MCDISRDVSIVVLIKRMRKTKRILRGWTVRQPFCRVPNYHAGFVISAGSN